MCWMSLRKSDDGSAIEHALRDVQGHEHENGHSWGYAAIGPDGEFTTRKGVGRVPESVIAEAPAAVLAIGHTRKATTGTINEANAHPFAIRDETGETIAYLAHNGTWREAPLDPTLDRADSWYIAREIERRICAEPKRPIEEHILEAGAYCGETMLVLVRDPEAKFGGRAFVYAGRYPITQSVRDGAVWSSGGSPLPENHLLDLAASDGSVPVTLRALARESFARIRREADADNEKRIAALADREAGDFRTYSVGASLSSVPNPEGRGYERWLPQDGSDTEAL